MNPFSSGTRLRDMIRAIRACKTAAEERAVVRKECAAIRAAVSDNDQDYRHRNLAKLMFIHMLGYPTHFGQMECLKLIASAGFPEKRIGYLGLMLLLDERQEVLMLVTNSLKQDLNHSNQYIVGLALCALGNICSAEMARDLAPEVEKLLQSRDQNIRKKAALCSIRIIRKVPDLAENFMTPAASLLKEKHHGVLITGVQLCTELCKASVEALDYLRKYTDNLVRVLKDLMGSPYAPEYDIAGITDPFLQIRLLRLLRMLGHRDADSSDSMNDILAQVAAKTESNKNAGNAILYECVATIMGIEANSGLRVLAINILGRFLSNRDNNIRYVALNMLMKAVAVDAQAVQRHRATILECVKDSDASIRKRALELVFLLVNDSNVKPLTKELIEYLEVSDPDFKGDLTEKICSIVEKFSPDKLWYIDQMLKVLSEAGNYVKDEVWHALIVVVSNASDLHGYTVRSLYRAFQTSGEQESLVRVAVWCIGEYGEMLVNNTGVLDGEEPMTVTESDAVDVIESALRRHMSDITTRAMSLIALLKLSSRFPHCSQRIREIIIQQKGSLVLELQQRSIEFNSIIQKHQNIKSALVERMPVLDEAAYILKRTSSSPATLSSEKTSKSISSGASLNLPNGVAKPPAAPLVDLLDLSSDDAPAPSSSGGDFLQDLLGVGLTPSPPVSGMSQASTGGADILLDLLSIGTSPGQNNLSAPNLLLANQDNMPSMSPLDTLSSLSSPASAQASQISLLDSVKDTVVQTKSAAGSAPVMDLLDGLSSNLSTPGESNPVYPSILAFQSKSLKIMFSFSKQPGKSQITLIQATIMNMSSNIYTDFVFQAAVPKFVQLHLEPASGNVLPASGNGSITQSLSVTNSQHGQKALAMRIRIAYKVNNQDVLEQGQINNFPPGL
ncbi:AP-1 complex subunit gamma-2-like [Magnolia sinica]|uniref:AP-1 complex subunit gamma-2-like n=1 Tax=Magnolia sinica TaxID=86752 RepID=UPI00265B6C53|nr:AP-1 complex subunit gamma-2-like [Magnolia sinica]